MSEKRQDISSKPNSIESERGSGVSDTPSVAEMIQKELAKICSTSDEDDNTSKSSAAAATPGTTKTSLQYIMSAPLLSPSKVRKGEFGCYPACLTFPVEISVDFATDRVGKMNVKSAVGASFVDKDILAPLLNTNKVHYHIFDPSKYAPSEDLKELEVARKKLQHDLILAGKQNGGCKFACSTLQVWGIKGVFHRKTFLLKCSSSTVTREAPSNDGDPSAGDGYKLASTNGTRDLHSRPGGNKTLKRKTG